jgi:hypothetical protein
MKTHPSIPQNVKVRMAQMEYLALLLPKLDPETVRAIAGTGDTAAALDRIALFCAEPKSAELRRVSIHVVLDLCEMDAEAFGDTIRAMSIGGAEQVCAVLDTQLGVSWRIRARVSLPQDHKEVRCAFSDRNLHSRMPLDPTHVRLKRCHACDKWHSSQMFTFLTSSHCKLRPNT